MNKARAKKLRMAKKTKKNTQTKYCKTVTTPFIVVIFWINRNQTKVNNGVDIIEML